MKLEQILFPLAMDFPLKLSGFGLGMSEMDSVGMAHYRCLCWNTEIWMEQGSVDDEEEQVSMEQEQLSVSWRCGATDLKSLANAQHVPRV